MYEQTSRGAVPEGRTGFARTLRRALERSTTGREQVAAAAGIDEDLIDRWATLRSPRPPTNAEVFALETALDLEPGELSWHLGFLPLAAGGTSSVPLAILNDPDLTDESRDLLIRSYKALRHA